MAGAINIQCSVLPHTCFSFVPLFTLFHLLYKTNSFLYYQVFYHGIMKARTVPREGAARLHAGPSVQAGPDSAPMCCTFEAEIRTREFNGALCLVNLELSALQP